MGFTGGFRSVFPPTFDPGLASKWWLAGGVAAANCVAGNVSGSLLGNIVGNVSGSVATVLDKVGYTLDASGVQDILDATITGTFSLKDILQVAGAVLSGKVSGAGTSSVVIRNMGDTADVITATTDSSGNRTAVTIVPS